MLSGLRRHRLRAPIPSTGWHAMRRPLRPIHRPPGGQGGLDRPSPRQALAPGAMPLRTPKLGVEFPYVLNGAGQNFKAMIQLRSGGVRPLFDQGWMFWNGVAGDFLFGRGVGDGTRDLAFAKAFGVTLGARSTACRDVGKNTGQSPLLARHCPAGFAGC